MRTNRCCWKCVKHKRLGGGEQCCGGFVAVLSLQSGKRDSGII